MNSANHSADHASDHSAGHASDHSTDRVADQSALPASERIGLLIAQLIDGQLSVEEAAELNRLVSADAEALEQVVDQLLLDSLLADELNSASLTALVDMVADGPVIEGSCERLPDCPPCPPAGFQKRTTGWKPIPRFAKRAVWAAAAAAVVMLAAFLVERWDATALADATAVVRAAMVTHAEPIERIYVVTVERSEAVSPGLDSPREVRVTTQGDRFLVEMNRGERGWVWGRDADGAIWLTAGPRRALVIAQDELGAPLQYISDLYSLNLESLLQNVLKHCTLTHDGTLDAAHTITATARRRWHGGWLRTATIEVDRETKAVRRLVIDREIPQHGTSTVTFTLVDSRTPDEAKYRPEGHLTEPFRLLTRNSQPDNRRELLVNWFGPYAERWIKSPGTAAPTDGKNAIQD
jgi:hypothetical protein